MDNRSIAFKERFIPKRSDWDCKTFHMPPLNGVGMSSVSYSQLETVRKYIQTQEEHHQRLSFQDELRQLLRRYALDFDERYLWD